MSKDRISPKCPVPLNLAACSSAGYTLQSFILFQTGILASIEIQASVVTSAQKNKHWYNDIHIQKTRKEALVWILRKDSVLED